LSFVDLFYVMLTPIIICFGWDACQIWSGVRVKN